VLPRGDSRNVLAPCAPDKGKFDHVFVDVQTLLRKQGLRQNAYTDAQFCRLFRQYRDEIHMVFAIEFLHTLARARERRRSPMIWHNRQREDWKRVLWPYDAVAARNQELSVCSMFAHVSNR
jgi:hypothetical protein